MYVSFCSMCNYFYCMFLIAFWKLLVGIILCSRVEIMVFWKKICFCQTFRPLPSMMNLNHFYCVRFSGTLQSVFGSVERMLVYFWFAQTLKIQFWDASWNLDRLFIYWISLLWKVLGSIPAYSPFRNGIHFDKFIKFLPDKSKLLSLSMLLGK